MRGQIQECGHYVHPNACEKAPGYIWVQDANRKYGREVVKHFGGMRQSFMFRKHDNSLDAVDEMVKLWQADKTLSARDAGIAVARNHLAGWARKGDTVRVVTTVGGLLNLFVLPEVGGVAGMTVSVDTAELIVEALTDAIDDVKKDMEEDEPA